MLYCKECGILNEDITKFCPGCGTPIAKTKPSFAAAATPPPLPVTPMNAADSGGLTMVRATPGYGSVNLEDLRPGTLLTTATR